VLQSFFEWMESLAIFGSSPYLGPGMNLVHLLAMVVFAGAVLIVDLRLLGLGLTTQPVRQIARDAQPWLVGGLTVLIVTGIPAMMATATRQYVNWVFWAKMGLLLTGILFTFTVRRTVLQADEGRVGPVWSGVVGLVSIGLWGSVAAGARLIMLI
jgi:hypothetical protein